MKKKLINEKICTNIFACLFLLFSFLRRHIDMKFKINFSFVLFFNVNLFCMEQNELCQVNEKNVFDWIINTQNIQSYYFKTNSIINNDEKFLNFVRTFYDFISSNENKNFEIPEKYADLINTESLIKFVQNINRLEALENLKNDIIFPSKENYKNAIDLLNKYRCIQKILKKIDHRINLIKYNAISSNSVQKQ